MEVTNTKLSGVKRIVLKPFIDHRGFWMRTFDEDVFISNGIPIKWVQENHSRSLRKNTIRGLHFLLPPYSDSKLVRCIKGKILDIIVDLRKESETFGHYEFFELSEERFEWIFIPKGFAHGFCTLENNCEMIYRHGTCYQKEFDSGIIWNDPEIGIIWPVQSPVISEKDSNLMTFRKFKENFGGL